MDQRFFFYFIYVCFYHFLFITHFAYMVVDHQLSILVAMIQVLQYQSKVWTLEFPVYLSYFLLCRYRHQLSRSHKKYTYTTYRTRICGLIWIKGKKIKLNTIICCVFVIYEGWLFIKHIPFMESTV